jgi:transcriptional regulator with XRE-family HTH domain
LRALTIFRIRAGLTQQELADLVGVAQATINRYEKGERTPRPATLGRLADALGVEEWDLTYAEQVMERRHAVERLVEEYALAG